MSGHTFSLRLDEFGAHLDIDCGYDPADLARPCAATDGTAIDVADDECVWKSWTDDYFAHDLCGPLTIPLRLVAVSWTAEVPEFSVEVERG